MLHRKLSQTANERASENRGGLSETKSEMMELLDERLSEVTPMSHRCHAEVRAKLLKGVERDE
jgi:hypothetical protein